MFDYMHVGVPVVQTHMGEALCMLAFKSLLWKDMGVIMRGLLFDLLP